MISKHRSVAGLAAVLALTALSAGCTANSAQPSHDSSQSTAGSTSSTSAQPSPMDYVRLLLKAEDIDAPIPFIADKPSVVVNASTTVMTTFRDSDGTRTITDSIQIAADPQAAARALDARKSVAPQGTAHGIPESVDVGTGGTVIVGPSPDGSKDVAVLLFTEGKAFVEMDFEGPANVIVPPEFVTELGQKQDAVIKKGLANV